MLQEYVLIILKRLKEVIDEVPFGIRWLCKATRALVQEKFPDAEVETINAFVGGFFFLRYINPVIVTPHGELCVCGCGFGGGGNTIVRQRKL